MKEDKKEQGTLRDMFNKRAEMERIRNYATSNITILNAAINVMQIGLTDDPHSLVPPDIIILPKPTEAVTELLKMNPKEWLFSEIVDELNRFGVRTNSPNISSSISSALRSLEKAGDITVTGVKRKRKYKWSADN